MSNNNEDTAMPNTTVSPNPSSAPAPARNPKRNNFEEPADFYNTHTFQGKTGTFSCAQHGASSSHFTKDCNWLKREDTRLHGKNIMKRKAHNSRRIKMRKAKQRFTKGSAAVVTLRTYELLEAILLEYSFRKLFVLQRRSKTWRGIMQRSEALRRKMFLTPSQLALAPTKYTAYGTPQYPSSVRLHPACRQHHRPGRNNTYVTSDKQHRPTRVSFALKGPYPVHLPLFADITGGKSELKPDDWRQMLLTQPPIKAVRLLGDKTNTSARFCTVWNPNGITLGDPHDVQQRVIKTKELCEREAEMATPGVPG